MDRWDSILSSEITNAQGWPCVALGKLLTEQVLPVDGVPFDQLQTISISFKGIVTRRSVAAGQEYSMRLKFAPPGSIVASKIDLKNSALGVVGDDVKNAVVTSHFVVYEPSDDLIPEYLHLLMQTQKLKNWLRLARSGTDGRTEVKLDAFKKLKVPLPSVDDQRALVTAYHEALGQAAALEAEAAELETAGLRAFEAALGIVPPPPVPDRPLFVGRFSDIARWSHEAVLRRVTGTEPPPSPYPIVALEDVIADLENGWSPQCLTRPADGEEWGVLKVGAVSTGVYNPHQNKALPAALKPRPALEVRKGDLLIGRANVTRLVGATAFVDSTPDRLILCDKIFRAVPFANAPVRFDFLAAVLKAPSVREQIEGALTGTSPTMKNISKPALLSLTFPMPTDLAVQTALVADLTTSQTAAAARRGEALATRRDAWRSFETAIYGDALKPIAPDALDEEDVAEL